MTTMIHRVADGVEHGFVKVEVMVELRPYPHPIKTINEIGGTTTYIVSTDHHDKIGYVVADLSDPEQWTWTARTSPGGIDRCEPTSREDAVQALVELACGMGDI